MGFSCVISVLRQQPKIAEVFRTGEGFEWGDNDTGVFEGQARLNRTRLRSQSNRQVDTSSDGCKDKLHTRHRGSKCGRYRVWLWDFHCYYG